MRDSVRVTHETHILKSAGSNPAPASIRRKKMMITGMWHVDSMLLLAIGIWLWESLRLGYWVFFRRPGAPIVVQFDLRYCGLKFMAFSTLAFSSALMLLYLNELHPFLPKHSEFFILWIWLFSRAFFPAGIVGLFASALKGGSSGGLHQYSESRKEWVQKQP